MSRRRIVPIVVVALVALACGRADHERVTAAKRRPSSTTASTTTSTTTTPSPPTTVTAPTTATSSPHRALVPPTAKAAPAPATRLIDQIADTGGATKVITVDSPSWASTSATMILWERQGGGVGPGRRALVGVDGRPRVVLRTR